MWPWGICVSKNFFKCRQCGQTEQIFWGLTDCPGHGAGPGGTRLARCFGSSWSSELSQLPASSQDWCCGRDANSAFSGTSGPSRPRALLPTQWQKMKAHYLHTESSAAWYWNSDTTQHTELELALKETRDFKWANMEFHFHNIFPTSLLQAPVSTEHAFPERSGFCLKAHKKSALLLHSSISGFPFLILELMFLPSATTPRGS